MLLRSGISGFLILLFCGAQAQSLQLLNLDNHLSLSNDTLLIQSKDNGGWVGFESLDLRVIVKNTSSVNMEIGVKKVEYETLPSSVQHTICFAGQCYDVSTFVSPFHVTLTPGAADSGFIAHYLFDNTTHVRGVNHIAYVFYDVNHPNDSVFVHVIYNSLVPLAVNKLQTDVLNVYPVPASELVTVKGLPAEDIELHLTDITGKNIWNAFSNRSAEFFFSVASLKPGVYLLQVNGTSRTVVVR